MLLPLLLVSAGIVLLYAGMHSSEVLEEILETEKDNPPETIPRTDDTAIEIKKARAKVIKKNANKKIKAALAIKTDKKEENKAAVAGTVIDDERIQPLTMAKKRKQSNLSDIPRDPAGIEKMNKDAAAKRIIIREARAANMTFKEIEKKYGIPISTASRLIKPKKLRQQHA